MGRPKYQGQPKKEDAHAVERRLMERVLGPAVRKPRQPAGGAEQGLLTQMAHRLRRVRQRVANCGAGVACLVVTFAHREELVRSEKGRLE